MNTKPIYSFNNTSDTGLDKVPLNSLIFIEDFDGGKPKQIILTDNTSIDNTTTIETLITTLPNQYENSGFVLPLGSIIAVATNITGAYSVPATGVVDGDGWMYCDGAAIPASQGLSGSVPNLTDGRFLRGSTVAGSVSGSETFTLATTNMPAHTHTGGAHTHTGPSHSHSINHNHPEATTGTHDGHAHPRKNGYYQNSDFYDASTAYGNNGTFTASTSGRSGGIHSHTFNVPDYSGTSGSSGTGNTGSGGDVATSSVGSGTAMTHIPQYVNVQYIIKAN